jgi:hypothetical protein
MPKPSPKSARSKSKPASSNVKQRLDSVMSGKTWTPPVNLKPRTDSDATLLKDGECVSHDPPPEGSNFTTGGRRLADAQRLLAFMNTEFPLGERLPILNLMIEAGWPHLIIVYKSRCSVRD